MTSVLETFAAQPILLLVVVVGVGSVFGRVTVRGIGLGAAAVLFTAIALGAWASSAGVTLAIPPVLGSFGLALFAFSIGIAAGPNFFHSIRTAYPLMIAVAVALLLGAGTAVLVGGALGLDTETVAGAFAGALTNTPALAAAGGTPSATTGYAVTYLFGVLGMLVLASLALRNRAADRDVPAAVVDRTIRVETTAAPSVRELQDRHGGMLRFSRIRHEETGPAEPVDGDTVLNRGDVVTVVGPATVVAELVDELGHLSSHDLVADRSALDNRRITLSTLRHAGRTVAQLGLEDRFHATVVRVRRGDIDSVATSDTVLQLGDRIRVVAPRERMGEVTSYLGDSTRGLTDVNPAALGIGLALGLLLGEVPIPVPGGTTFEIGAAAGTLFVGLVMGRLGRVGPVVTSLPQTATAVLSEIGLLVFLAYAGANAGGQILGAFVSGDVVSLLVLGVAITLVVGVATFVVLRLAMRVGGTMLSGILAGAQTQPAVLAFANGRTGHDPRVARGYALVYPTAMVIKILLAQVLGGR